jgi:putative copper export protein
VSGYRLAVFLHLLAASVWVGGYVLFSWAAPALRRRGPEGAQAFRVLGLRFRGLSWLAVAVLVGTGLVFLLSGWDPAQPVLRDKLGLVGLAVALKAAHDFWAAPAAARGALPTGWATALARANLVVLLAVLYFATQLRGVR